MTAYFLAVWTPLQVADCSLARSDHQSAAWLWFVPCWYMAQAACLSEPSVLHIRLNWTGRRCLQLRQWQNNPDWPVEWNGRDGIGPADLPAPSLLALQLFGMGSGTRDKFPKQPVSMITSKSDNSTSVPFKSSPCIVDSRLCQISQPCETRWPEHSDREIPCLIALHDFRASILRGAKQLPDANPRATLSIWI